MAKPFAVTGEASAASNSLEDAFETGFLPEDPEYRMTGKMPDKEPLAGKEDDEEEIDPPELEEQPGEKQTPAANDKSDDTAAASEAAKTTQEKKEPVTQKTTKTSENRFQKITRENRELREKNARLEGRAEATTTRETTRETQQATTQAAADGKDKAATRPQIDDVDPKTGKAKYSTYAEYETAKDEWLRADVLRTFQETTTQSQRQQQQTEQQRAIVENLQQKFETSRAKHDDFDTVALNPKLVMPMGSVTDGFLQDSEHGGEVAYYLGQHPEILEGFYGDYETWVKNQGRFSNKITPQQQFRKLMAIEAEVSGTKTPPAKTVTAAGRPPHQTSGNGTVGKDAIEQALEEDDTDTYMAEANSRDPRLQAVKASRKKG